MRYGGFLVRGPPKSSILDWDFPSPSILEVPHFRKPPYLIDIMDGSWVDLALVRYFATAAQLCWGSQQTFGHFDQNT